MSISDYFNLFLAQIRLHRLPVRKMLCADRPRGFRRSFEVLGFNACTTAHPLPNLSFNFFPSLKFGAFIIETLAWPICSSLCSSDLNEQQQIPFKVWLNLSLCERHNQIHSFGFWSQGKRNGECRVTCPERDVRLLRAYYENDRPQGSIFFSRGFISGAWDGCLPRCYIDIIIWEKSWLLTIILAGLGWLEMEMEKLIWHGCQLELWGGYPPTDFMCKWQCWGPWALRKWRGWCCCLAGALAHADVSTADLQPFWLPNVYNFNKLFAEIKRKLELGMSLEFIS